MKAHHPQVAPAEHAGTHSLVGREDLRKRGQLNKTQMRNTPTLKKVILLGILMYSWIHINAQCLNQVLHTSGTITINGTQVTVIPSGDCDTLSTYCSGSTQPYIIGATYNYPNHNGGYTFQFSPAIDSLNLNFSGIHDDGLNKEIVKIYVNGDHYNIPSVGLPNECGSLAVLTPLGEITGATNGTSSGWNGTLITGPISEIYVIDSVAYGSPGGAVFSLFFCSKHTTSIDEDIKPEFLIYPIPTKGNITISAPNASYLKISNMQGQVVLQQTIFKENKIIDLSILGKGIYLLTIDHNGTTEVRKIVKE